MILNHYLSPILVFIDILLINLFFFFGISFCYENSAEIKIFSLLILHNSVWILIAQFFGLYKNLSSQNPVNHFSAFFKALFIFIALTFIRFDLIFQNYSLSTLKFLFPYLYYSFLLSIGMIVSRFYYFIKRRKTSKNASKTHNTIVVGNNADDSQLKKSDFIEAFGVRGFFNVNPNQLCEISEERIAAVKRLLKINDIHNVILCFDALEQNHYSSIMSLANKNMIRTYIVPEINGVDLNVSKLISVHGVPMIQSISEPLQEVGNRAIKRLFDITFSLLIIIFILSWLYPLISLIMKIKDNGPVVFKQKRTGYLNQEFYCLKFRTMTVNPEADLKTATKEDPRITKLGAFLRKTSIDELPQFINVLKGEMSVVGPRPHMVSHTKKYSELVQKYMIRHFVKPGITGWAQVMGSRGEIKTDQDMVKRVEKDVWYIFNWSFLLDLKIIVKTIINLLKGDQQAY